MQQCQIIPVVVRGVLGRIIFDARTLDCDAYRGDGYGSMWPRAGGGEVRRVTLRIGRLAGVHEDPLRFSFDLVREGTPLAAAELAVIDVPVRIWCPTCEIEVELPGDPVVRLPGLWHPERRYPAPGGNSISSRSNSRSVRGGERSR